MIFKVWGKNQTPRRRPRITEPRKDRAALAGTNPRLKQRAYDRLAILRAYHRRLSKPRKPGTKTKVMRDFLDDLNSKALSPEGATGPIPHIHRSTLYNWCKFYRDGRLPALVPRYQIKSSTGRPTFRPLKRPIEMKFPGRPRRNGKAAFLARIKRRWKNPPLECPIRLSIFYSMPIPKGTKMPRRMWMLEHRISHTGKPNLDVLNAFLMDCLRGIIFRDHSQIVQFHSEKKFEWWPQIRILIKPFPG